MPIIGRTSPHAASLRRAQTDVERTVWFALRDRRLGGFKFRRQATIGTYIVDFLCVSARLVIELDGGQHGPDADAKRTAFLESLGYRILRFWNNDVVEHLPGVLEAIHSALIEEEEASPSPNPLPHAGEG